VTSLAVTLAVALVSYRAQLSVTSVNESHRALRQLSATRPRSSTTMPSLAAFFATGSRLGTDWEPSALVEAI